MAISTSVSVRDNMSAAFMNMTNAINVCLGSFTYLQQATETGIDASRLQGIESAINDMNVAAVQFSESINDAGEEQRRLNDQVQQGTRHASELGSMLSKVAGAFMGIMSVGKIKGFMSESMELFDIQTNAERQLHTVLANMLDDDYVAEYMVETQVTADTSEAVAQINAIGSDTNDVVITVGARTDALQAEFDAITAKASEIQSRGIYGDEAMIAGAAELATYFTDTDAIETMMDTLANYAMGMSGGAALDTTAMTDYATGLGKVMTGSYDAMTKKGFEFTDAQKAIIEGTATEEQVVAALGAEYLDMSDDMQAAAAITQVIDESWVGLYESMSNTPRGQIIQMTNTWGDMKEVIGGQLYPYILLFVNAITSNWPTIEAVLEGFVQGLQIVLTILSGLVDNAFSVASVFVDNWSVIEPLIMGAAIALGIYSAALMIGKGIQLVYAAATAVHTLATSQWTFATFAATVQQEGLNAALAACPITWIIVLIIALIAIIYAVAQAVANATGVAESGFGVIMGCLNVVLNLFINLGKLALDILAGIALAVAACAGNMGIAFNNAICNIQSWFYGLLSTALTVVAGICEALNKLPFIEFDYSGVTAKADEYAAKASEAAGNKQDYVSVSEQFQRGFSTFDTFETGWASEAFDKGAAFGDSVANKVSGAISDFFDIPGTDTFGNDADYMNLLGNIGDATGETASGVGDIADSMEVTEDNLEWIKDIAEREIIDRTIFRDITIDLGGVSNTVNNMHDLDSIPDYLGNVIAEQMAAGAEGVHN